jgi:hypothetical protein
MPQALHRRHAHPSFGHAPLAETGPAPYSENHTPETRPDAWPESRSSGSWPSGHSVVPDLVVKRYAYLRAPQRRRDVRSGESGCRDEGGSYRRLWTGGDHLSGVASV